MALLLGIASFWIDLVVVMERIWDGSCIVRPAGRAG